MASEKILCIPRAQLPQTWMEKRSVQALTFNDFIDQCTRSGFCFVDRSEAEKDTSLKQVIPYIVIQTSDMAQTAVYNRQGSEERLHDLWSLGIGGHINPVDNTSRIDSFQDILETGMYRELSEELERRPDQDMPQFSGIINEDLTDVGSVHLGAVFRILTQSPEEYLPGSELFDFQWMATQDLKKVRMELWSELALELFSPK